MRLFSVSNLANSIGDNRFSSEVDRVLLEDAVKLGYKYCNRSLIWLIFSLIYKENYITDK